MRDEEVKRVLARDNKEVDDGWLCDQGRYGFQMMYSQDRYMNPVRHIDGVPVPAGWDDAVAYATSLLAEAGSSTAAIVGDASNEEGFLVQGIVRAADVAERLLCNQPLDMSADLQRPLFVPETTLALSVFDTFKTTRNRVAIVIDEYGGVQGLVTLTDILEEVVGDVAISQETIEPQIVQRDDGSWLLDGLVSVQRLADLLGIALLEDNARYETLGGFVMSELGRIPTAGDSFTALGFRFEVMDMDGHRVDKMLVMPAPLTAAPE